MQWQFSGANYILDWFPNLLIWRDTIYLTPIRVYLES